MSAAPASRVVVRQSRLLLRRNNLRHASTTAETASKAKEAASETASKVQASASQATSKAGEGLSRVTSSASSMASGAAKSATNAANQVQSRTSRYISLVQGEQPLASGYDDMSREADTTLDTLIPSTIYYSRVGLELGRLVFKGQGMAPYDESKILCTEQQLILLQSINLPRSIICPTFDKRSQESRSTPTLHYRCKL